MCCGLRRTFVRSRHSVDIVRAAKATRIQLISSVFPNQFVFFVQRAGLSIVAIYKTKRNENNTNTGKGLQSWFGAGHCPERFVLWFATNLNNQNINTCSASSIDQTIECTGRRAAIRFILLQVLIFVDFWLVPI